MDAVKFQIDIQRAAISRRDQIDFDHLPFGKYVSDHMLVAECVRGEWRNIEIRPYGPFELMPSTSALHYGQAIFEGMKAYRAPDGSPLLFRPEANWERINRSARRMCMPEIPYDLFLEGIRQLISLDRDWVPEQEGSSLYIRPFMIATDAYTGIRISDTYKFIVYTSPVGKYYSNPVKLRATANYVRAFPGGTGEAKSAGNYAGALLATKEAKSAGYDNVLWLDGIQKRYIEEVGTMNVMFIIDGVAITPELGGTILRGTTRTAVIQLLREHDIEVVERRIGIDELWQAHSEGRLQEAFGLGTAATVAPISVIGHDGSLPEFDSPGGTLMESDPKITLPGDPMDPNKIGMRILRHLTNIRTGKEADRFGWTVRV
ncbi:MAG: branched-chain amino acid aminotransferase [Bacteroidota bacterium]